MAAGWAVSQCVCWVDITVISVMEGQLTDPVQKEHMKRASEGNAPMLTVQWIINTTHGHGTWVFGLASVPGTDTYKYTLMRLTLSLWAACVLCCHLIAAAVCSPPFSSSLYLLRCVYLTHSSQRGNKLALNNNPTDNYGQAAMQRKEWDNMGHWPFSSSFPLILLSSINSVIPFSLAAPFHVTLMF